MITIRLTQFHLSDGHYRIETAFEGGGLPRRTATVELDFRLEAQDQEDIRWYLEDYLQYPADPAPRIAARVEGRMAELGSRLFKQIFYADDDARELWSMVRHRLSDARIEIATGVREATALPWELLRDPKTDAVVALRARAFVRAAHQAP